MNAVLVYQNGIANVFEVASFNMADYGRDARRLMQGDFAGCANFARGMVAAGASVATASCNVAGDCARVTWTVGKNATPFRDQAIEVWSSNMAERPQESQGE